MFNAWHISIYYINRLFRSGFTYFMSATIGLVYFAQLYNHSPNQKLPDESRQEMVKFASQLVGSPYRTGGISPAGFDCSGFTRYVYRNFDTEIPRSAQAQFSAGTEALLTDAQPGDLVFFNEAGDPKRKATHVGLINYTNGTKLSFFHASVTYGISLDSLHTAYFNSRFIGIRSFK